MKCANCFKDTAKDSEVCSECKKKIVKVAKDKDGRELGIVPASQGRRLANLFIDSVVYWIIMLIIGFIEGLIFGFFRLPKELIKPVSYTIAIVGLLAYYIIFEAAFGQTIGKMVSKTRVVANTGKKASVSQVIVRSFSRFIPFDYLSLAVEANPIGWHDSIAKTYVVRTKPFE